jgi:hypothetical protein
LSDGDESDIVRLSRSRGRSVKWLDY